MSSRRIAKHALNMLLVSSFSLCTVSMFSQEPASGLTDEVKGITVDRLQIPALKQSLRLEETNEIPILLHGFKVKLALAHWNYTDVGDVPQGDGEEVTIQYRPDGSAYVNFTPEGLGKVTYGLTIFFEDGYTESERLNAEVVLPKRKPDKVYGFTGMGRESSDGPGTIYLDLSESLNTDGLDLKERGLDFRALYEGAAHSVPILLKLITFKIISANESDPPIAFNAATGVITALHLGDALLQATFDDVSTLVCVDVVEDSPEDTVCSELVPAGKTAPKSFRNRSLPPVPKSDKPPQ